MKTFEQYFHMLPKVVQSPSESVDKTLVCDHQPLNEMAITYMYVILSS